MSLKKLIKLLNEYQDCFAWKYYKMPSLSQSFVEHQLPIKPRYCPFKQEQRKFKAQMFHEIQK